MYFLHSRNAFDRFKKQKSHKKQQDLKDFIFGSETELSLILILSGETIKQKLTN